MLRFEFYLARELRMTRGELRERMTGNEFAYWIAFVGLEAKEQERAQKSAQNRAKAAQLSKSMNR